MACQNLESSHIAIREHIRIRKDSTIYQMSCVARKPVFGVSEKVRKTGSTATEDCLRLEISNLRRRSIVLSIKEPCCCAVTAPLICAFDFALTVLY